MSTQTKEYDYKGGEHVKFTGYEFDLKGAEPILKEGQLCVVESVNKEGAMTCLPINAKGERDKKKKGDTTFAAEVELVTAAPGKPAAKKKGTPAKKSRAGKAPAKKSAAKKATAKKKTAKKVAKKAPAKKKVAKKSTAKKKVAKKATAKKKVAKKGGKKTTAKKSKATTTPAPQSVEPAQPVEVKFTDPDLKKLLRKQSALEAAEVLCREVENTYYRLGAVLFKIDQEKIHETLGFKGKDGFADYVEQTLRLDYRTARYLIAIFKAFREVEPAKAREALGKMGWSKAKEIARVPIEQFVEDFDKLVDKAVDSSREDLQEHINKTYVTAKKGGKGETVKRVTLKGRWTGDAATTVENAIQSVRDAGMAEDDNQAILHIVTEWALANEDGESQVPVDEAIAAVERRYDVELQEVGGEED